MNLFCYSLAFDRADLTVREHYALDAHERGRLRQRFLDAGASEALTLCTCNRTEIYFVLPKQSAVHHIPAGEADFAANLLAAFKDRPAGEVCVAGVLYRNEQVAEHLFALACGLRSLIIGETEILGQLKTAYADAVAADTAGKTLNRVFQRAFSLAKQIRTGTSLGRFRVSVASVAVRRLRQLLGEQDFQRADVVVWGTGTVGAAVVRALEEAGANPGTILSRRQAEVARLFPRWRICGSEALPELAAACDALICATGAPHPLVHPQHLQKRKPRLLLADLSVPRNIDPACATLAGVSLFTVDDLAEERGILQESDASISSCDVPADAFGAETLDTIADNASVSATMPAPHRLPESRRLAKGAHEGQTGETPTLAARLHEEAARFWRCALAGNQERCIARWRQQAHRWLEEEYAALDSQWPQMPPEVRERYCKFARSLMHRMLHLPSDALRRAIRDDLPCADYFTDEPPAGFDETPPSPAPPPGA